MECTVTFAGVEITAEWDVDSWYLEHVPYPFRERVARLLDAEADRLAQYDDGDPYGGRRIW